jgi:hypothetical protein
MHCKSPLAYQPTDTEILSLLTATSSRTSISATSTSKSPTSTSTSPTPVPDGSLSKGSKIAIGVIVPVVVLTLMIATSFFWIRRRRNSQVARPSARDGTETWQPKAELHGESAGRPLSVRHSSSRCILPYTADDDPQPPHQLRVNRRPQQPQRLLNADFVLQPRRRPSLADNVLRLSFATVHSHSPFGEVRVEPDTVWQVYDERCSDLLSAY